MRKWFSRSAVTLLIALLLSGLGIPGPRSDLGFAWPVGLTGSVQAQEALSPSICVDSKTNPGGCERNLGKSVRSGYGSYWGGNGSGLGNGGEGLARSGGIGAAGSGGQAGGGQSQSAGGSQSTYVGDPINYAIGNVYDSETDYMTAGTFPLVLARHYNSLTGSWRMSYSRSITYSAGYTTAKVTRDDGQVLTFTRAVYWSPDWTSPAFSSYRLHGGVIGCCGLELTTDEDEKENYDGYGKLTSYSNRAGLTLTFTYDGMNRLSTVRDPFNRTLIYDYDSIFAPLSRVHTPDGGVYNYQYDGIKRLTGVTYPDGSARRYLYGNGWWPRALTEVVDENGSTYTSYSYDNLGRAISTQHAGGADLNTVTYSGSVPWSSASVTTPLGATKKFTLTRIDGLAKQVSEWRSLNGSDGQSDADTYDGHANVTSHTDFNGNRTSFVYDQARNLPTSQTLAAGTPLARTITTSWHPNFRLPTQIVDGDRTSTFTYDAKGNLLSSTVASGASASTRSFTYNSAGRVLTAKDPRNNQTSYAYDTMSNLVSVTNPLGHVTTFTNYDANGRPGLIRDPNGVATALTYNFRGQVASSVTLGQTTSYSYDKVGQLTMVQDPSGAVLNYFYDAAHRLVKISDRFGNRIVYTLDAAGNRTKEETFDPSGALARTHSRAYDRLERLSRDIGAASQTSSFSYDANDNVVGRTDPNGNAASFAYDALNRLTQLTEPEGAARTRYAYDALGRLASVTDPRNLVTSYANNWLDEPTTTSSPDTRVTTKTYDAAGNVLTSTDARGQKTTYAYDALNRIVKATHADGFTIVYGYDQGAYGLGRLASVSDGTGKTSWSYDAFGHVLQKTQTTGLITLSTKWSYDAATGRLASVTYPSGVILRYSYDAGGRVSAIGLQRPGQAQATLIDQIAYRPFGPVASWRQAASGRSYIRRFDQDGRVSGITTSTGLALAYAYDAGGRVASTAESGRPTKTYSYDRNDRLIEYHNGAIAIGFVYDPSGNRTVVSGQSHTIDPGSNRLLSLVEAGSTPRQMSYDAAGGMTSGDRTFTFAFDARNRLKQAGFHGFLTSYSVNGLGQRVAKSGPAGQVEYYYDLSGRLLGSYGPTAAVREEIVWLGDLPIATLQGGATYFIAPDRMGTPHQIVNSANAQVWYWDHHPFGETLGITTVAGFRHELRFPGQIYDSETGLFNNGFRDYWPFIGRYIESDPIGIEGGINTYAYAGNNPVNAIDPFGLDPKSESSNENSFEIGIAATLGSDPSDWIAAAQIIQSGSFSQRLQLGFGATAAVLGSNFASFGGSASLGTGSAARSLANQNPLYKAAVQPFKGSQLSNAGRALTKHPEVIGEAKDTLRQILRNDDAINDAAHAALRDIIRNGATSTPTLGRYGTVTQIQIPGGFGARWASDGNFIGFINP